MKKLLTLALALIVLAAFSGTSNAQKKPGPGVPVPLPGYTLTVQVIGPQCPPPAPGVKNTPPWGLTGQKINCTSAGGDCSEANIPAGTTVRLSTAPFNPTGSWSITGGLVTPTPGTCGYSAPNVGHKDCEFKMPPNNIKVIVELPCPPPPATSCTQDLNSGVLTISQPTASNITATSASLTGTVSVNPVPPGCTYSAKLVWGPAPTPPFPNTAATGSIPPSPLTLGGTASPLNPSSAYGARIEVTKACGGLVPTVCIGPTKFFETPKGEGKAEICVLKFEDKNGNGVQNIGELGLPGWTFTVAPGGPTITTGSNGTFCFGVPAPATYTVTEQVPSGWTPTTPTTQTVTVSPGQLVNLSFGNKKKEEGKCDLEVKKSLAHMAIHPPFSTGQQIAFEIYVTNQGNGTCSAPISVTENFSAGLTYVSGGTSGWVCPPGSIAGPSSVTCTYNQPIAPSQTSMFLVSFSVTGPPPKVVENCASVKHPSDTNVANNRACLKVPIQVGKPCKDVTMNLSTGQSPWTVNSAPAYSTSPLSGFWVLPVGGASWIHPVNSPTPQTLPAGNYQYRAPFTLPGPLSQYSSITITGQYAADNSVTTVSMNGGPSVASCTGPIIPNWGPDCFSTWHPFSITAGFAVSNTLDVTVGNNPTPGGGPTYTGLIVNATLRAVCKK